MIFMMIFMMIFFSIELGPWTLDKGTSKTTRETPVMPMIFRVRRE